MSKYKKIEVTPRKLQEIKDDTAKQMILLLLAYLMDEVDYSAEKLIDVYNSLTRYVAAINDHLISVKAIQSIIKNNTNLEIRWNG